MFLGFVVFDPDEPAGFDVESAGKEIRQPEVDLDGKSEGSLEDLPLEIHDDDLGAGVLLGRCDGVDPVAVNLEGGEGGKILWKDGFVGGPITVWPALDRSVAIFFGDSHPIECMTDLVKERARLVEDRDEESLRRIGDENLVVANGIIEIIPDHQNILHARRKGRPWRRRRGRKDIGNLDEPLDRFPRLVVDDAHRR